MRIAIYEHSSSHVLNHLKHFAIGLMQHAERFEFIPYKGAKPTDCDLAVFWGHKRHDIISHQRENGRHYLVLERGYMGDRREWTSAGFDGLNGRANFGNRGMTGARFEANFADLIKPWKQSGAYLLVIGQCRQDEAVRGLDIHAILQDCLNSVRPDLNMPARFRPHPEDPRMPAPDGSTILGGTLADALSGAHVVLTINSNVGVDAALAGVPVVALDKGSMAWPIAGHAACDILSPMRPEREQWAAELAWCQWNQEELTRGEAWEHLRYVVDALR